VAAQLLPVSSCTVYRETKAESRAKLHRRAVISLATAGALSAPPIVLAKEKHHNSGWLSGQRPRALPLRSVLVALISTVISTSLKMRCAIWQGAFLSLMSGPALKR